MTLARMGIVVAVAGGIALPVHAYLLVDRPQRSDCAAWGQAAQKIVEEFSDEKVCRGLGHENVVMALGDPDMNTLWRVRLTLACEPKLVSELLPALYDPTFIGLGNAAGVVLFGHKMPRVTVDGSETPPCYDRMSVMRSGDCMFVADNLYTRAGRASWLLKQATAHPAPIVGVKTDPKRLADLARDWQHWLEGLHGGRVCSRF